jgi:dCMP deaminase
MVDTEKISQQVLQVPLTEWDYRWLKTAEHYASFSKDPSTKVGALTVKENRPLSQGWNGFPRGIEDSEARLNNREVKYEYVVHAEMNSIYNAACEGVSLKGATLYVHGLLMCSECCKGVLQSGIKRVVMRTTNDDPASTWSRSWLKSKNMMEEAGVEYVVVPAEGPGSRYEPR